MFTLTPSQLNEIAETLRTFLESTTAQTLLGFLLGLAAALALERNRKPKLQLKTV
jgi:carbohydrate-binding DOMON domain-containing protein